MSEDTYEVATKSFLQIIVARIDPGLNLSNQWRGSASSAMGKNKVLISLLPPTSSIDWE
jgi:hypothetical protein